MVASLVVPINVFLGIIINRMPRKMMTEDPRVKTDQSYEEHAESKTKKQLPHQVAERGTVRESRTNNMAPNFRVIKFIHLEIQNDKTLNNDVELIADSMGVKGPRQYLMIFIATQRRGDRQFNLLVQNLTRLDRDMALELKKLGRTNEEISDVLEKNEEINKAVKNLVKAMKPIIQNLVKRT